MIIKNLKLKYPDKLVFENLTLELPDNKITSILGPSGVGKTSILKAICNLVSYEGYIEKHDKYSFIFQEDRLINSITVLDNLKIVNNNLDKIIEITKVLEIDGLLKKYPNELSGGEKKRVNIARAFIYDSDIILSDEALSSLDESLRFKILKYITRLFEYNNKTIIMVTHNILEALSISDKIILINDRKILKEYNLDSKKMREFDDISLLYKEILNFFKEN